MPPSRRSRTKKQRNENDITIEDEKRVPLTSEMKVYLSKSPMILVPNLKLNIKDIPKASVYDRKKKAVQQPKKVEKANVAKISLGDNNNPKPSDRESVSDNGTKSTSERIMESRPGSSGSKSGPLSEMRKVCLQENETKTASPKNSESPSKVKDFRGDDSKQVQQSRIPGIV